MASTSFMAEHSVCYSIVQHIELHVSMSEGANGIPILLKRLSVGLTVQVASTSLFRTWCRRSIPLKRKEEVASICTSLAALWGG